MLLCILEAGLHWSNAAVAQLHTQMSGQEMKVAALLKFCLVMNMHYDQISRPDPHFSEIGVAPPARSKGRLKLYCFELHEI